MSDSNSLYSFAHPKLSPCKLNLVPYYTLENRKLNQMRVWIPEIL
ncbi:hypothetical protein [Cellulosilyticum ruminicola]